MNSKYTGEAQHPGHHHDGVRVAVMLLKPAEPAEPQKLHHRHRQERADIQNKPRQDRQGGYSNHTHHPDLLHQHLPLVSFAFETFLPNPGDYSFLYTGDPSNLTTKWWLTSENITENGMYGQKGILYNDTIWTPTRVPSGSAYAARCSPARSAP